MPETGGPVSEFTAAIHTRDLSTAAGLLAHDVQLVIPPLHYVRQGASDVAAGIAGLLGAFGEFRYELGSRYLGPGTVTDEAVLVGRQTGPFLGAPPNQEPVSVPARVMIDHDGVSVTRIALWPDLAALRASVAGADQVIDLRSVTRTGGMIAALRATLPPRQTRIVVAGPRIPPPPPEPAPAPAVEAVVGTGRPVPKAPVPKSVRRRRSVLGGSAMLVTAVALAAWVAVGALSVPRTPVEAERARAGAAADATPGSGTAADQGPGPAADDPDNPDGADAREQELAPADQLAAGKDTVTIQSELLFATDSAKLQPGARRLLDDLVAKARQQGRRGPVTVNGYTDDVGAPAYNLRLSRRRAAAVKAVLQRGLRGTPLTVSSRGYGETRPARRGTSPAARRANRRVTVVFPPAS